jgi:hypothetical protein
MRNADDQKIMRILAVVEAVSDPRANQVLLDPLRTRLASLEPARPLRFARLLFLPLDPAIVPASDWRPNEPSVPRTVITSISTMVRTALAGETSSIDKAVAGRQTDAIQTITEAGDVLWPRAAEILADAPMPLDWSDTGLRPTLYKPLALAIAAVLRRAPQLRRLMLNGEAGPLKADDQALNEVLVNIGTEPADGCAMIARLVLMQSPHAAPLWRQLVSAIQDATERTMLQKAMTRALERVLTAMEGSAGFADDVGRGPLASVAGNVRRISSILEEVQQDTGVAQNRGRLRIIRDKLDHACRQRFTEGLSEGIFAPLAAAEEPIDGPRQTQLENCARDLRSLETAARRVGSPATYDGLLKQAYEAVNVASGAGALTPIRRLRLVEILSGPEAAKALLRGTMKPA